MDLAQNFYQKDDMVPLLWPQDFLLSVRMDDMVSLLWPQNFLLFIRRMRWFLYYELSEAKDKVSYYGHIIIGTIDKVSYYSHKVTST